MARPDAPSQKAIVVEYRTRLESGDAAQVSRQIDGVQPITLEHWKCIARASDHRTWRQAVARRLVLELDEEVASFVSGEPEHAGLHAEMRDHHDRGAGLTQEFLAAITDGLVDQGEARRMLDILNAEEPGRARLRAALSAAALGVQVAK